jgi:Family of unknown function (DUF6600)/FecR protein
MAPRKLASVLLMVCAAFLPALLRADSKVRIVRLSYVEGDVQIDRRDGRGFERAILNMPVVAGARLRTGDDARAEVEFEKGSTIRILPATTIEFTELSRRDSGQPSTSIKLQQGTAYFNLRKDDGEDFGVEVGRREIRLSKSAKFRLELQGSEAKLAVTDGKVKVAANTSTDWVAVGKKQTLILDTDDSSRDFLAKGISPHPYDEWDKQRKEYRDRYGSSSDLSYYGNFNYVAPYGYVWRPARVSAAWDPFADGAWVWYPGFGYMWVSGYTWGWAPYHYGSWLFISGYGWCWNSQGGNGNWNNAPTVWDPPRGFNPPRPPASGGGTGVVVVGRGPSPGGAGGRQPTLDTDLDRTPGGLPGRTGGPRNPPGSQDGSAVSPGRSASASGDGAGRTGPSRVPTVPSNNRIDGRDARVAGGLSGSSHSAPPTAPSAPHSSMGGGGSSNHSAPSHGGSSGSFGGSHSSGSSSHGGSQPRSNNPR